MLCRRLTPTGHRVSRHDGADFVAIWTTQLHKICVLFALRDPEIVKQDMCLKFTKYKSVFRIFTPKTFLSMK
jgi:hypothetical protein